MLHLHKENLHRFFLLAISGSRIITSSDKRANYIEVMNIDQLIRIMNQIAKNKESFVRTTRARVGIKYSKEV